MGLKTKKKKRTIKCDSKSHVAIEIDSGCIKAVQMTVKKNGSITIDRIAAEELKYFTYDEVPELLKEFLKKNGFKKREVVSCFPRNLTTIRFISLPSTDPKELVEMVNFQALKQIPYNKEDMIVDFEIESQNEDGYSNVLLAIAHKNIIYQHIDTIENAGIITKRIDINSQAILRSYLFLKNLAVPSPEPQELPAKKNIYTATALIDIDYTHTNIQIMSEDKLLFTRGITLGIIHLILKEKKFQIESANINWQSELMDELRRSLAVFSREQSEYVIDKIVLTGGISNFSQLERNISSRFQIPVEVFNLKERIPSLSKFEQNYKINGKEVSIMSPIGLLLPGKSKNIDMIPQEIKDQKKNSLRIAKFSLAAILFACILGISLFNFYMEINRKSEIINELKSRIDTLSPRVKKLEAMREKINIIRENIGDQVSSLDFLRELYVIIPEKIFIFGFLYDESKYIIIKGTANNMSEVFDLIPKLENSQYFEKVSSRGVKRRKVEDKEVVDFEIQCSLVKGEEQG